MNNKIYVYNVCVCVYLYYIETEEILGWKADTDRSSCADVWGFWCSWLHRSSDPRSTQLICRVCGSHPYLFIAIIQILIQSVSHAILK